MSNYTKATNFASKDSLPVGDANKKVKGVEIDNEFNALSNAISTKADLNSPELTGIPSVPTATADTSTTQIASTAFVTSAVTTAVQTLDGTGLEEASGVLSISDTGVTADTYGSATEIPVVAVNAQGQITSATTASVVVPTLTHFTSSTSIGDGTTFNLPTDTFALSGTAYHQMNGSTGSRMDVQVYAGTSGGGTLIDTYICTGGNELDGTDGGSGMRVRSGWTILLPANARSVKFVKGDGASSFGGNIETGMKFTGYHS
jgi:hypothetical protein